MTINRAIVGRLFELELISAGIWAIDFADTHPETAVVGVDLSASE